MCPNPRSGAPCQCVPTREQTQLEEKSIHVEDAEFLNKETPSPYINLLLKEGDRCPSDCGNPPDIRPEWMNAELYRRGQKFYQKHIFGIFVAQLAGLLYLMSFPRILKVLVMTKKSGTAKLAYRRYLSTLFHVHSWYEGNIFDPDNYSSTSMRRVRTIHRLTHGRVARLGVANVTQVDMVVTQFGFVGVALLYHDRLGIRCDRHEMEGLVHLWRVLGFALGIDDRFNLCRDTLEETLQYCEDMARYIFRPCILNASPLYLELSDTLLYGCQYVVPPLNPRAFKNFTFSFMNLPQEYSWNPYTLLLATIQKIVFDVLFVVWGFRWFAEMFFNFLVRLALFIRRRWPDFLITMLPIDFLRLIQRCVRRMRSSVAHTIKMRSYGR